MWARPLGMAWVFRFQVTEVALARMVADNRGITDFKKFYNLLFE